MSNDIVQEISVAQAKSVYPNGCYIDNDLLLYDDFTKVSLPAEAARAGCLFLALCTDGKAQYTVDTKLRQVSKGDIIIVNEGQVVGDYLLSPDCKGIAIMTSKQFIDEVISSIHELSSLFIFARTHPVFHLEDEQVKVLLEYFSLVHKKCEEESNHFRREIVSTLLNALIYDMSNVIYASQQASTTKKTRAESIFTDFIKLVEQNFRHERRVGWYATQLCITPKYLSETVKTVSKRTPNEWIDNYVTLEIRVMLKNSTLNIKQIASELHFPNQSFLGKYFKMHVGMSPSQFRKS